MAPSTGTWQTSQKNKASLRSDFFPTWILIIILSKWNSLQKFPSRCSHSNFLRFTITILYLNYTSIFLFVPNLIKTDVLCAPFPTLNTTFIHLYCLLSSSVKSPQYPSPCIQPSLINNPNREICKINMEYLLSYNMHECLSLILSVSSFSFTLIKFIRSPFVESYAVQG